MRRALQNAALVSVAARPLQLRCWVARVARAQAAAELPFPATQPSEGLDMDEDRVALAHLQPWAGSPHNGFPLCGSQASGGSQAAARRAPENAVKIVSGCRRRAC